MGFRVRYYRKKDRCIVFTKNGTISAKTFLSPDKRTASPFPPLTKKKKRDINSNKSLKFCAKNIWLFLHTIHPSCLHKLDSFHIRHESNRRLPSRMSPTYINKKVSRNFLNLEVEVADEVQEQLGIFHQSLVTTNTEGQNTV